MSDVINNRQEDIAIDEKRLRKLKELILKLHDGESESDVKVDFKEHFDGVSSKEISAMENELMKEGLETEQIMKLCNVHASLFRGSIEDVHTLTLDHQETGHPIRVLKDENYAIKTLLEEMREKVENYTAEKKQSLLNDFNLLWDIDKHYSRKENTFFPLMEKYGHTAPPKVMWGVDDEIRQLIKDTRASVENDEAFVDLYNEMEYEILEMIIKEEEILIPMVLDVFTEDEWLQIAEDSVEIGYALVAPDKKWTPQRKSFLERYQEDQSKKEVDSKNIHFNIGFLNKDEIEKIFNALPVDITFIDASDSVKYFNQAKDRIFARTKSVIGRTVQNCHPPQSVNTVETLLEDFKSGKKDSEAFWIQKPGIFIHIIYYAIRDDKGEYIGTLEVTQNVQQYRDLEGEKRLLD